MMVYKESYHDNCKDYLKKSYIEKFSPKKYKQTLFNISKIIPIIDICTDISPNSYEKTIVCDQHAVIFTDNKDKYTILATYALNACVGLIMYVKEEKIGSIAHMDGLPAYSKLDALDDGIDIDYDPVDYNILFMLNKIAILSKNKSVLNIDFYLIGGVFELSEIMIYSILCSIGKFNHKIIDNVLYNFNFVGRNLLGPINQSRNICLDISNGKIFHFDFMDNSEYYGQKIPSNIIRGEKINSGKLDMTYFPANTLSDIISKK